MSNRADVKIILEGSYPLQLCNTNPRTVLDDIYTLAQDAPACTALVNGTYLHVQYHPFGKTHVLVSTKETDEEGSYMIVYGVKCRENEHLTYEDVRQRVECVFGSDVLEKLDLLTPYRFPDESHISDNAYPCGTLFIAGDDNSSSSSSPPLSPTPPHLRPENLSFSYQTSENADSPVAQKTGLFATVARPVATSGVTENTDAMIAGTSGFRQSNGSLQEPEVADDQSAPPPSGDFREGPVSVQTRLQYQFPPAQKLREGEAGGTTVFPNIELETPTKTHPALYGELAKMSGVPATLCPTKIVINVEQDVTSLRRPCLPETQTEHQLLHPGPRKRASSLVATNIEPNNVDGNQMVIGVGSRRISEGGSSDPRPVLGRCLSSPDEKVGERVNLPVRNASDSCLEALVGNLEGSSKDHLDVSAHATCDAGANLRTEVSPCKPTNLTIPPISYPKPHPSGADVPRHARAASDSMLSRTKVSVQEEAGPCLSGGFNIQDPLVKESCAGHTPTSPSRPMGIERQDSGKNEIVLPKQNYDPRNSYLQSVGEEPRNGGEEPRSGSDVKFEIGVHNNYSDGELEDEKPFHLDVTREDDSGEGCDFRGDVLSSTSTSSSRSDDISFMGELMQQVHLLEHACNEDCFKGDLCKNKNHGNLEFTQSVAQMKEMIEQARDATLEPMKMDELKSFIRTHFERCSDKDCKVPHIMAGCLPAGQSYSSSGSDNDFTHPSFRVSTHREAGPISFDSKPANVSTSSDVERYRMAELRGQQLECQPLHHDPLKPTNLQFARQGVDARVSEMYIESPDVGVLCQHNQYEAHNRPLSPHNNPDQLLRNTHARGNTFLPSPDVVKRQQRTLRDPSDDRENVYPSQRQRTMSPLPSGGFSVLGNPNLVKGQPFQESQIGTEHGRAYGHHMHQVSDVGRNEQKPLGIGQYSYLKQSRGGSNLLKQMYPGSNVNSRLSKVNEGKFPHYRSYSKATPGTVIYSTQEVQNVLTSGEVYPYPYDIDSFKRDKLGEGGNGKVIKWPLQNREFALKHTGYRVMELNVWSLLSHRNILPLQAVMTGKPFDGDVNRGFCYQFMPKMTDSLRHMMRQTGDLYALVKSEDSSTWKVVNSNVKYIIKQILCGLQYLHDLDIQHCDIKASNVLILKKCTCQDIFHCTCSEDTKYEVKIADFDSVKKTESPRCASQLPNMDCVPKSNEMMKKVMGTPAYRAPEQFEQPADQSKVRALRKVLQEGQEACDLEGPWCDMWSVGVLTLQMGLGPITPEDKNKGGQLYYQNQSKMEPRIEAAVAILRLNKLHSLSGEHPELRTLSSVAQACLEVDFRKRPAAKEVLDILCRV